MAGSTLEVPAVDATRLWRVSQFAEWSNLGVQEAYRQIAKGRVPGVIRFGKSIRIDPAVAIPALRDREAS